MRAVSRSGVHANGVIASSSVRTRPLSCRDSMKVVVGNAFFSALQLTLVIIWTSFLSRRHGVDVTLMVGQGEQQVRVDQLSSLVIFNVSDVVFTVVLCDCG